MTRLVHRASPPASAAVARVFVLFVSLVSFVSLVAKLVNEIAWPCDQAGMTNAQTRQQPERIMTRLFSIAPVAALMLCGAGAAAAELPTYEIAGFPISPHQFVAAPSAQVQERSPTPTLTLGGMPASPHQIMVLTPRSRLAEEAAPKNLTQAAFPSQQPN